MGPPCAGGKADQPEPFRKTLDFVDAEGTVAGKARQVDIPQRAFQQLRKGAGRIFDRVGIELRHALRRPPFTRGSTQIEKPAAIDRALRRGIAQHEPVACSGGNRPLQHQLDTRPVARRNRLILQKNHSSADFRCRMVQSYRGPLRNRFTLGRLQAQRRIDPIARGV
jgi:hypothetical protein